MSKKIGSFTFYNEHAVLLHAIETMLFLCDELVMQSDNAPEDVLEIAESFVNNKNIFLIKNTKKDNFYERDEFGDRQRLLDFAKKRNGDVHFHTDVDEIPLMSHLGKFSEILESCSENQIFHFRRLDLWGSGNLYRLNRNIENGGKIFENAKGCCVYPYVYSLKYAGNFASPPIPNFHSPRIPSFSGNMDSVYVEDCSIVHYGYFLSSKTKEKGDFYQKNSDITANCWGEDMKVSMDEYLGRWGMGYLNRNK